MALLPAQVDGITLQTDVNFVDYPTYTYYVDPISKQIRGMADGHTAMVQAVQVKLAIERYYFQIYTPNIGFESTGLIGQDFGYVISEIPRRINDAFVPDNRMLSTESYTFEEDKTNGNLTVRFIVRTVYGDINAQMEVAV